MPRYIITYRHTVQDVWYVDAPDADTALAQVTAGKVEVRRSEVLDGEDYVVEEADA